MACDGLVLATTHPEAHQYANTSRNMAEQFRSTAIRPPPRRPVYWWHLDALTAGAAHDTAAPGGELAKTALAVTEEWFRNGVNRCVGAGLRALRPSSSPLRYRTMPTALTTLHSSLEECPATTCHLPFLRTQTFVNRPLLLNGLPSLSSPA